MSPKASGRLELARWLAGPRNPLTARVIVNRVWRWHFGRGLVRSVDNFGKLGELPSHPELLDWLAIRFVEDGWSLKALHRRIMLSATYRMSTARDERAAQLDPEDRLLWRMPRRRMDAEELRDLAAGRERDSSIPRWAGRCWPRRRSRTSPSPASPATPRSTNRTGGASICPCSAAPSTRSSRRSISPTRRSPTATAPRRRSPRRRSS